MTAIYTRKSVHKDDSLTHQTQINKCVKRLEVGEGYKIYTDDGYSGGNTDRPAFKEMTSDIEAGKIKKVIVYRLDRISRSVIDFAKIWELFEKKHIDFVSASENFDTTTPMGEAMLKIAMVFAEMERKTIQERITHAYHDRSKKSLYMGGKVPLGYNLTECIIDGIKTKSYMIRTDDEPDIVRLIFETYAKPTTSLIDVMQALIDSGLKSERYKVSTTSNFTKILKNPCFTSADISVYRFLKKEGANIESSPELFLGECSLYMYSSNRKRNTVDLFKDSTIVVAPHAAIISPELWLACNNKLLSHRRNTRRTAAKTSILVGKMKCCQCGHTLSIVPNKGGHRYCYCKNRTDNRQCNIEYPTLNADELEAQIITALRTKLDEIKIQFQQPKEDTTQKKINELEAKIEKCDADINKLIDQLLEFESTSRQYIQNRIDRLAAEKKNLLNELDSIKFSISRSPERTTELIKVMNKWDNLSFEEQRSVIELTIAKIIVYPEKLEIQWLF